MEVVTFVFFIRWIILCMWNLNQHNTLRLWSLLCYRSSFNGFSLQCPGARNKKLVQCSFNWNIVFIAVPGIRSLMEKYLRCWWHFQTSPHSKNWFSIIERYLIYYIKFAVCSSPMIPNYRRYFSRIVKPWFAIFSCIKISVTMIYSLRNGLVS